MILNNPKQLAPIQTTWHNKSLSSVNSDAATFYTANTAHAKHPSIELEPSITRQISPPGNITVRQVEMSRQDSGFDDCESTRTSKDGSRSSSSTTSSSRRHHSSKQTGSSKWSSRSSHRPSASRHSSFAKRMASFSPCPASGASIPQQQQQQYQIFQFASLITPPSGPSSPSNPSSSFIFPAPVEPEPEPEPVPPPPPPPATVHYWTSDSTRRLEYEAIDAASRGVRGFIIRLIPDCFLPEEKRRPRFHEEGDDDDSDAGSVRRYRLALPDEKGLEIEDCALTGTGKQEKPSKSRKWSSSFGRKRI
ncbi:hypothetical protein F5884DRAFT_858106 [Xylogone sp. PMI_703]|nr:hypothetical protein F5884DRAFT_858106 [Xylogone sp. PMI_703]